MNGPTSGTGPPSPRRCDTPEAVEAVAAEWLRWWGYPDAAVTPPGADGGVDVRAEGLVAQVKAESVPTGARVVREIAGVAAAERAAAVLFSWAGTTATATQFADEAGVAVFGITHDGEAIPQNNHAAALAERKASTRATVVTDLYTRAVVDDEVRGGFADESLMLFGDDWASCVIESLRLHHSPAVIAVGGAAGLFGVVADGGGGHRWFGTAPPALPDGRWPVNLTSGPPNGDEVAAFLGASPWLCEVTAPPSGDSPIDAIARSVDATIAYLASPRPPSGIVRPVPPPLYAQIRGDAAPDSPALARNWQVAETNYSDKIGDFVAATGLPGWLTRGASKAPTYLAWCDDQAIAVDCAIEPDQYQYDDGDTRMTSRFRDATLRSWGPGGELWAHTFYAKAIIGVHEGLMALTTSAPVHGEGVEVRRIDNGVPVWSTDLCASAIGISDGALVLMTASPNHQIEHAEGRLSEHPRWLALNLCDGKVRWSVAAGDNDIYGELEDSVLYLLPRTAAISVATGEEVPLPRRQLTKSPRLMIGIGGRTDDAQ